MLPCKKEKWIYSYGVGHVAAPLLSTFFAVERGLLPMLMPKPPKLSLCQKRVWHGDWYSFVGHVYARV